MKRVIVQLSVHAGNMLATCGRASKVDAKNIDHAKKSNKSSVSRPFAAKILASSSSKIKTEKAIDA